MVLASPIGLCKGNDIFSAAKAEKPGGSRSPPVVAPASLKKPRLETLTSDTRTSNLLLFTWLDYGKDKKESWNRHPVEHLFNGGTMVAVLFVTNPWFHYKAQTPNCK